MAVNNKLVKAQEQERPKELVEYASNGETVKISPALIRKYLVSSGGNSNVTVTDGEVNMFLYLCRFQHLNPFIREAYLIKYSNNSPATMVVGKDVFLKRAKKDPTFAGFQAGIIVEDNETGDLTEREGTFYNPQTEDILGGWAKVFVKGYDVPFYTSVPFSEYVGRKGNGEVNGQWASKPATMIRKVALAQALKEAFPEQNSGMNAQEEIPEVSDMVLETEAVVVPEETTEEPVEERPADVAASIFG